MATTYRFPEVQVVRTHDANCKPCFNVLCKEYGNSGFLYSQMDVDRWIALHTKEYVLLKDHLSELNSIRQ